jgi:hypothetical protein
LDSDRFAALWLGQANEALPDPLMYTSRFRFLDGWEAFRGQTRLEYGTPEFAELHAALEVMAATRVAAYAVGATSTGGVTVRMLGCCAGAAAVVASQQPASGRGSGDVVVRSGRAEELAVMLARSMPPARPGRRAGGRFYRSDVEPGTQHLLRQAMGLSPVEEYRKIVHAPRTLTVVVRGRGGPGWAAEEVAGFEVFDVASDGRYLRHGHDPVTIAPAAAPDLAALFRTTLARAAEAVRTQ